MRFAVVSVLSIALLAAAARSEGAGDDGLDRLLRGMARSAGFEGHFVEEVELALLREPVRSHGVLYFVPPDRMARFTTRPVATALLIDGERVEFRDVDGSRIDLSRSPLARHVTDNLLLLFSGDRETLEARYTVSFEESEDGWQLTLTPRHAPLSRALARITLGGQAARLDRMEVLDSEGARTVTQLAEVRTDRPFAAAELVTLFEDARPLAAPDATP